MINRNTMLDTIKWMEQTNKKFALSSKKDLILWQDGRLHILEYKNRVAHTMHTYNSYTKEYITFSAYNYNLDSFFKEIEDVS
ncbi:MAG: hypothetical protein ACRCXT_04375 [Paraclostridium sp.]